MLTPEDSKRVADALIEQIEQQDLAGAVKDVLRELFWPHRQDLKPDWVACLMEDMCSRIVTEVGDAIRERI